MTNKEFAAINMLFRADCRNTVLLMVSKGLLPEGTSKDLFLTPRQASKYRAGKGIVRKMSNPKSL